jgi:hypothetical protein
MAESNEGYFMRKALNGIPVYPFLVAVYPVLALLGHNISEVRPGGALRSVVFSLLLSGGLLLLFRLTMKRLGRAVMAAAACLIVFYSYGHVYASLRGDGGVTSALGRHRYLLPLAAAMLLGSILLIRRVKRPEAQLTTFNILGLLLLLYPGYQIGSYEISRESAQTSVARRIQHVDLVGMGLEDLSYPGPGTAPDIYYIVLDAYGRSDALERHFNIDNDSFLNALRELGFSIAGCSQSNYSSTILSVPSTLNMQYVDTLLGEGNAATVPVMVALARNNLVRRALEGAAYRIVSFESGYSVSEWEDAHDYYELPRAPLNGLRGLSDFESLLLDTTMLRVLRDVESGIPIRLPPFLDYAYLRHRGQILNVLDQLPAVAENPASTFTIAHVLAPHEPFVFGPNGEHVTQSKTFTLRADILREDKPAYTRGYTNQLQYVNDRVLRIVADILERSPQPPIIILQGDHGPKRNMSSNIARLAILNAYYLPGVDSDLIYPSISPVNTFRLILNTYFGADLPLLPDESYLSAHSDLLDFWAVGEIYWPCRDRMQ